MKMPSGNVKKRLFNAEQRNSTGELEFSSKQGRDEKKITGGNSDLDLGSVSIHRHTGQWKKEAERKIEKYYC